MVIAFLNIALCALMPLFFAMPVELGGLGFQPPVIGYIIGSYGLFTGIFQTVCFSKITGLWGEHYLFAVGTWAYLPVFMAFPVMNVYAQQFGITPVVWILIAVVVVLMTVMDMAFGMSAMLFLTSANLTWVLSGCIFIYITASTPTKRSLGAVNGLSQMAVSTARAVGPAISTSLFSLSVERNLMGGYAVYFILFVLSGLALLLAAQLPHKMWEHDDDNRQQ